MKNILFLLHLPPPVHGSSMVGQFINESDKINKTFSCRYINLLASSEVGDTGKVTLQKIIGFMLLWFRLLGALIRQKPDLCYFALTATGGAFYRDIMLVTLLKLFRVKRVFHMHNKGVSLASDNPLHRMLYQFVFSGSDVILLSQHLYQDIKEFVSKDKVWVCANGIPDERCEPETERDQKKDCQSQILFLSNLIESKGVFVLLKACAILNERDIQFRAVFIGGEGDITSSQFRKKAELLNIADQAHYIGKRYGEEKFVAFSAADIFAFPTYYPKECLPLVLIEAMQFELPIVTTPEGGIPDLVEDGETGHLVPQKDADTLADKLEELIEDKKLRNNMGKAGRARYEEQFTIGKFEQRMTHILQTIVEKSMSQS